MRQIRLEKEQHVDAKSTQEILDKTSRGNSVVLNHWTQCGHCIMFKPEWEKFRKDMVGEKELTLISIEMSAARPLFSNSAILQNKLSDQGQLYFPMIIVFVDGKKYMYQGERTAEALKKFYEAKRTVAKPRAAVVAKPKAQPKAQSKAKAQRKSI